MTTRTQSLTVEMMTECETLVKMHVGMAILQYHNNTLQIDDTTKKFKEYSTFNITTGSGEALSLGFEDQASGSADDYMKATKIVLLHVKVVAAL